MAKAVLVNSDRTYLPRYLECHLHDILLSFFDLLRLVGLSFPAMHATSKKKERLF